MDVNVNAAVTFGELLQKNPKAAAFYDSCTPDQRQAILLQLSQINSPPQPGPFVDTPPGPPFKATRPPLSRRAAFFF